MLWATHLIDEISAADGLVVLHHGRVLAHGSVPSVIEQTGAADIRAAFSALTKLAEEQSE